MKFKSIIKIFTFCFLIIFVSSNRLRMGLSNKNMNVKSDLKLGSTSEMFNLAEETLTKAELELESQLTLDEALVSNSEAIRVRAKKTVRILNRYEKEFKELQTFMNTKFLEVN